MINILITGASGFLGKTMYSELINTNNVQTLSRNGLGIQANLANEVPTLEMKYDLVIHCAGKAHQVPKNLEQEREFFDVNVNGTLNLFKGLEAFPTLPKFFVLVSSVAVYGLEVGSMVSENGALNAADPYGKSKVEAERVVLEWCEKNNVICTILRLPLIAGPNPPGNLAAMISGIKRGFYFDIAGGKARKSIVLAEDVASIIPKVIEIGGIYNLTDRQHPKFFELSRHIAAQLGKSRPSNIPRWMAVLIARVGDFLGENAPINSNKLKKITSDLTFDDQKAVNTFGWNPSPVLIGFKIK